MNDNQQDIPKPALSIVEQVGDEVAQLCIERFHHAVESADLDESLCYEVLQNLLARITAKVLVVCFGSSSENLKHYASDFIETARYHIDAELTNEGLVH